MSAVFDWSFFVTIPFWGLMILAPTWSWTRRIAGSPFIVLPTLVTWLIAAVPVFGPLWTLVTNPSLTGFQELLADPAAVTAIWAQIIAWDLFIGRWMYLDSRDRGVHPLIMAPVLVLTILLSPVGLPLYFAIRSLVRTPAPHVGSPA
ncbi:uncharacterized protein DUF4281 [Herbihabitans rhizosphaerae]|uniref:Uncharacterized protein DUF4281 n=1 Tax=Herbihabitans rhizosphaerae TaxID=1872711 RepID=A0A4Q7KLP2_9PSEU|nr:ABA4-like family protein [Herbihabitans rhizosphaerae]RZS36800.1 uncharacterized protein DUF4281 [Herbihabitans rhizosphaerae]